MEEMVFEGIVISGLGKGAVFLSIDHYKEKIKEKLGFGPYPGTLNIKVDKQKTSLLTELAPIRIEGIKKDSKAYGGANCFKIRINNVEGAIIMPDLTEHGLDSIEIIAPINLKSELKIKDGDKVKIQLVQ
jgi:riboflavin kinase, archaea type